MANQDDDEQPDLPEDEPEEGETDEGDEADASPTGDGSSSALARVEGAAEDQGEGEADEEDVAAGQLGIQRYVLAGFFATGMLAAYVIGRAFQSIWINLSSKDWFAQKAPALVAISDEEKGTIGLVLGAIIAVLGVVRTYRRPDVRSWTDDVASELAKCRWPTRKEVWNSTVIVIAASAVATIYLALLDRLWAFVTNLVYGGDGS